MPDSAQTRRELLWQLLEYIRYESYKSDKYFVTFPGIFGTSEQNLHHACQELADKGLLYQEVVSENECNWKPVWPARYYI